MPESGNRLSAQTFDKILRNPVYAGWITSSWGIEAKGAYPALVSEDLFMRVQSRLNGRGVGPRHNSPRNEAFPLRVFLKCNKCGKGITGSFSRGRNGTKYPNYRCRTNGCGGVNFRQEDLHARFNQYLFGLVPDADLMPLFTEVVKRTWKCVNEEWQGRANQVEKLIEREKARKQRLIDYLLDGKIQQEVYDSQMERVGTSIEQLQQSIPSAPMPEAELSSLLEFAEWLVERVAGIWNSASLGNKQRLQQALFPKGLTVSPEGFGTGKEPFFFKDYLSPNATNNGLASPGGFEPPLPP
jgi:site-specific DNA recombinase